MYSVLSDDVWGLNDMDHKLQRSRQSGAVRRRDLISVENNNNSALNPSTVLPPAAADTASATDDDNDDAGGVL